MVLGYILLATGLVGLISFVGVFTLSIKDKLLHQLLPLFVAFAAGSMLAAAFFHMLPEAIEAADVESAMPLVLAGVVLSLLMERLMHWHHHHKHHHDGEVQEEKPIIYLNLIGDAVHNFVDGTVIATSFMASPATGLLSTIAIIAHEVPQEIGDFSVLIWGGLSKGRALLFNFLSALTAIAGGVMAFYLSSSMPGVNAMLLPLAAGNLIYISCSDLVPELHREKELVPSILQLLAFGLGIALIVGVGVLVPEPK